MNISTHFQLIRYSIMLCFAALVGCAITESPIPTLTYSGPESDGKNLVVALRGIGGSVKSFEKYHFIRDLHRRYPGFDVVIPNAHFGYYKEGILIERLEQDVFAQARAKGYEKIWLVGVSLGGLGTLKHLQCCAQKFAGAVLIAPYTGEEELHTSIEDYLGSGSKESLEKSVESEDKDFLALWAWILDNGALFESGNLWLGFGNKDRLSGHELLASHFPDKNIVRVEGGHKAKVFSRIWNQVLDQKPFE